MLLDCTHIASVVNGRVRHNDVLGVGRGHACPFRFHPLKRYQTRLRKRKEHGTGKEGERMELQPLLQPAGPFLIKS